MSTIRLKPLGEGEPIDVQVEYTRGAEHVLCELDWAGKSAEVQAGCTAPGAGWIRRQGETLPFYVTQYDQTIRIWIRGQVYTFELPSTSARRMDAPERAQHHEILAAPMPGTVLQIKVSEGQPFRAHQPLIILESMKMEMTLSVPHSGEVERITCAEGELVEMGAVLATLREANDG
jgi:biotin carboxyl carrier protein